MLLARYISPWITSIFTIQRKPPTPYRPTNHRRACRQATKPYLTPSIGTATRGSAAKLHAPSCTVGGRAKTSTRERERSERKWRPARVRAAVYRFLSRSALALSRWKDYTQHGIFPELVFSRFSPFFLPCLWGVGSYFALWGMGKCGMAERTRLLLLAETANTRSRARSSVYRWVVVGFEGGMVEYAMEANCSFFWPASVFRGRLGLWIESAAGAAERVGLLLLAALVREECCCKESVFAEFIVQYMRNVRYELFYEV